MKKMLLRALPLSAALLVLCLCDVMAKDDGGVTVSPVAQDADAANGGVVYALPRTVLRVKLTAQAVVETAGPFYQYSTRLLNLTDVVTQNAVRWSLVSADVETVGVADYSRRFKVSAEGGAAMPTIRLSPDGVLLAANADVCQPSPAPEPRQPEVRFADFSGVPLSQSVLSRTSKAAMADDVAQSIYALRSARVALISGDREASLPDAGALAYALEQISRLERQHVELFAGRRDTVTVVRYVDVVPDYDGANSQIPIRFSETAGFVDALDLTGKPVYVDFEFSDAAKLNALPDGSKQRKSEPLKGLRYCAPGCLAVRVLDRNISLCQKTVLCSQNGQVAELPSGILATHSVVLDPATGALVSISALAKR